MKKESLYLSDMEKHDLAALPAGARSWITAQEGQGRVAFTVQEIEPYEDDAPPPSKTNRKRRKPESEQEAAERLARLQRMHWWRLRGERPFSLRLAAPGHALVCRVEPADGSHHIYAADGTLLARTTRYKGRFVPWPRRARWRLDLPGGESWGAAEGSPGGWALFSLVSPVLIAIGLGSLALCILGDGSDFFFPGLPAKPTRTRWRTGSECALEYRGMTYHTDPEKLDHRVAYAQSVIHQWLTP